MDSSDTGRFKWRGPLKHVNGCFCNEKKNKRLDQLTAAALPIVNKVSASWTSLIRHSFSVKLIKGEVKVPP